MADYNDMKKLNQNIEYLFKRYKRYKASYTEFSTEEINEFGNRLIPGNHLPPSSIIEKRRKKSPQIINTLSKNGEILAYYVLYPLKKSTNKKILMGELYNAKSLELNDISDAEDDIKGLYIGMLLGSNRIAKAMIMSLLFKSISEKIDKHNIEYVFAKAGSQDGIKIISHNGFKKIDNSQIQVLRVIGS